MKIAFLSDIHDNVWKLASALDMLRADVMMCCGDLCSPFIVDLLAKGFAGPVHVVFGNNDADLYRITVNAGRHAHMHLHGAFFETELDGKLIAINHYPDIALGIAASAKHDVVGYGHDHILKIGAAGRTVTINPGAIMGYDPLNRKEIASTYVLYDTGSGQAASFQVA